MEGIFKVVKSSEVSFRKKKFQNELQHQSRRREMKSSKVEEGLLSRSMLGFQDVQNAKWFYKFFCTFMPRIWGGDFWLCCDHGSFSLFFHFKKSPPIMFGCLAWFICQLDIQKCSRFRNFKA